MSTLLFSTCFLDGHDELGNSRLERTQRYLKYYRDIKDDLGFTDIVLCDNASSMENLNQLGPHSIVFDDERDDVADPASDLFIYRHDKRLKAARGWSNYPYCWRGLYFLRHMINVGSPDKIICIDTDGFVISRALMDHIRGLSSGWTSFLERKYQFPEAALWVLCRDEFDVFLEFTAGSYLTHQGKLMETTLPLTHIETKFNVGRYGEDRLPLIRGIDYYGQCPPDIVPKPEWELPS